MKAHDRDRGFNGALVYVISSGDVDSAFDINPDTGELRVAGRLDRETTPEYVLNVTVYDQGLPRKSASRILTVSVLDCNDNAPVFFKSSFSFFFPENTLRNTTVVTLNATDPDAGLNGRVTYVLDTETEEFRLDSRSGLLIVNRELDRETKEYYDLRIRAVDSSPSEPLSSTAVVRVRVLDVNDVAPAFSAQTYLIRAREDLPVGSVVGMVEAHDPDLYHGGKVRYSLVHRSDARSKSERDARAESNLADNDHFIIDEVSGVVKISSKLDYETKQLYNLTVKATDEGSPPLSSYASFVVEVLDVNENLHPPRFKNLFLRAAVPENLPAGAHVATVTAVDADGPDTDDGRVSYSIRGGDGLGSFLVDEGGSIRTLAPLDREAKSHYWLTVHAQDQGAVPLSSKLYVYVEVLDVNDNVPLTVEPIYFASVEENSSPFTEVATLQAHDGDDAGNTEKTEVSYEIVSGNPQSLFRIDAKSGIISTTKRKLDRETQAEHELEVRVSDGGVPPLNSTTKVVITVTDVNDNSPEFLERFYKISVPETVIQEKLNSVQNDQEDSVENSGDESENREEMYKVWEELFENSTWRSVESAHRTTGARPVFRPLAYDRDQGENGLLTFSMKVAKNDEDKLQVDPLTGIVYASRSLLAGEQHEMLVRAMDGGKKWALARVKMKVKTLSKDPAVNRHPPRILQAPQPVQIFESDEVGHLVSLVVAEDKDGDDLWYSIVSGDEEGDFYINPERGSILLARTLDWERKSSYNLSVSVTDGRVSSLTFVPVAVIDVNERRPHFSTPMFEVDVPENASVGYQVAKLNVSDGDSVRQRMSFSIHSAQDLSSITKFRVSPGDGAVTLKKRLDHELARKHLLTVAVKDQGTPAKAGYARVAINVVDHNDHSPKFLSSLVQTSVHETAEVGAEVVQLVAVDVDRGEAGRVSYSIISGNSAGPFSLDASTGMLRVAQPLDLRTHPEYTLVVRATDHGTEPSSATVPVHVQVTMADDKPPRFSRPHYSAEVYENRPRGSFVARVAAWSTSAVRYRIASGDEDSVFSINPGTGIIMAQRELDFETRRFYNLTVEASSHTGARATCTLAIHVLDLNDNVPEFEKRSFSGQVSESVPVGSLVLATGTRSPLVVKATDGDSGVNSLLRFEILENEARRFFAIDESTGAVRTVATLDHEERRSFSFNVRVSDMGSPRLVSETTTRVDVDVGDENDSPPRFLRRDFSEILLLPTFQGVEVLRLEATDPDTEVQDQRLRYGIVGGDGQGAGFAVEEETGRLLVADKNALATSGIRTLDVSVSDGRHSDRAVVRVQVEEADSSGLAFGKERYHASVVENTTRSEVVAVVTVLGAALNEDLRFSLLNPTDLFSVGATSGAVSTTGVALDREERDRHELLVEVRSADHTRVLPRVAHVAVEVEVLDVNDNAPVFVGRPYKALVPRGAERDSSVLRVSATDADDGENGNIYYQLVRGNGELFRVGRKSGQVTLRQRLDGVAHSGRDEFRLTLAAYDGGTPPFSEEVSVHIKIVDETVPAFTEILYKAKVREDVEPYSPVVAVMAEAPSTDTSSGKSETSMLRKSSFLVYFSFFFLTHTISQIFSKSRPILTPSKMHQIF